MKGTLFRQLCALIWLHSVHSANLGVSQQCSYCHSNDGYDDHVTSFIVKFISFAIWTTMTYIFVFVYACVLVLFGSDANNVSRDEMCRRLRRWLLFTSAGHSLCMTWSSVFVITTTGNNDTKSWQHLPTPPHKAHAHWQKSIVKCRPIFQWNSPYITIIIIAIFGVCNKNTMAKECSYFSFTFYCMHSKCGPSFHVVYVIFLTLLLNFFMLMRYISTTSTIPFAHIIPFARHMPVVLNKWLALFWMYTHITHMIRICWSSLVKRNFRLSLFKVSFRGNNDQNLLFNAINIDLYTPKITF